MQAIVALDERNEQMQVQVGQKLDDLAQDILLSMKWGETIDERREDMLISASTKLTSLMNSCRQMDIEQRQLGSLTFESMKERKEDSVKEAHRLTLDWLLTNSEIGFSDWLRCETGIYWIRGKGSCFMLIPCHLTSTNCWFLGR